MKDDLYLRAGDFLFATQYHGFGWALEGPKSIDTLFAAMTGGSCECDLERVVRVEADGVVTDVTEQWAHWFAERQGDKYRDGGLPEELEWLADAYYNGAFQDKFSRADDRADYAHDMAYTRAST